MRESPIEPTISVIIPVYRVERYVNQCVESVLTQTWQDLEVIMVDDGSPDASGRIADEFAARDPRVHVIHQPNQGLSGARNAGLARARGRYVVFLDSDDFWEGPDSLATCVTALKESPETDVLFFDALRYYESTGRREFGDVAWDRDRVRGASREQVLRYMVEANDVRPSACTKVIRRQFLVEHGLGFKQGIFSEDVEWFLRLITHPATYDYLPLPFYLYRKNREGSITNTIGRPNVEDVLDTVVGASRRMLASDLPAHFQRDFLSYCAYQFTIALAFYGGLAPADRRDVRPRVREARFLLAYDGYNKSKAVATLARVIGLDATALALNAFLRLRAARSQRPRVTR